MAYRNKNRNDTRARENNYFDNYTNKYKNGCIGGLAIGGFYLLIYLIYKLYIYLFN